MLAAFTVGTACVLPGNVADGLAAVPRGAVTTVSVAHLTGGFSLELELNAANPHKVIRTALLRTARLIMRGEVMVPYRGFSSSAF